MSFHARQLYIAGVFELHAVWGQRRPGQGMSFFPSNISRGEIRKAVRQPLHRPAWIDRGDGAPLLDCMIWDVSAAGAKLTVGSQEQIPEQFTLLLSKSGLDRRRCRLVWRLHLQVGIQFVADQPEASIPNTEQLDC
jgi:hypothetical protein